MEITLIFDRFILYCNYKGPSPEEEELTFRFEWRDSDSSCPIDGGDDGFFDIVDEDASLYDFLQIVVQDKQGFRNVSFDELIYRQSEEYRVTLDIAQEEESSSRESVSTGRSVPEPTPPGTPLPPTAPKRSFWEVLLDYIKAVIPLILALLKKDG